MSNLSTNNNVHNMLDDLREETLEGLLKWLPLPTAGVLFYVFLLVNRLFGLQSLVIFSITIWAVCACLLAQWMKARHLRLAAVSYVAGVTTATFALIWVSFSSLSMAVLPAIILLSLAILGIRAMATTTVLSSLVIPASAWQHGQLNNAILGPLAVVWLTALIAWLSQRGLITAVEWAWNSYNQARASTEDARHHRGELARTLKALDDAYRRLERFSVQLAQAREAAEEARRTKQAFVANVSHELRTPLNIIIGFSEMLALSPEAYGVKSIPRQFMGDINRIYRSARHLKGLIDDVLDLSQVDARRMPLLTEQAALPEVVTEATDMMESLAAQKGLRLVVDIPESLPSVFLDRVRIRQVLLNLLSNAIHFTETGQITVSVQLRGRECQATVSDTGPGIAPQDLGRVFEEFHQLDASLNRRHGGTGLGLTLSRRFVELHGGHMWVESELGKGSCFHFTLPLDPAVADLGKALKPLPSISSTVRAQVGQTVLVTTEEPMVVNLLKRHLRGYQVIGVPDEDLQEAMETYLPHAVITSETTRASKANERFSRTPVISCPLPDPHHLSQALGVDKYLVKPVTRERLLSLLTGYGAKVQHILIVDDDAQFAELIARIVQGAPSPYAVDIACGGKEGVAQMQKSRPDLVLLDLMMQDLGGLEVLHLMRADEELRDVPVVIVTARDLPGEEIRLLPHNHISVQGPEELTVTEVLDCVQAILDALPPPRPSSSPPPGPGANLPAPPAS